MQSSPGILLKKVVKWIIIILLGYLVVINGLLWLPLTQTVVNMIRPDKFAVRWDSAWSPYPFRVYVKGASANGQSRSQQWQVDVGSASGSISLLPLVLKQVRLRDINAADISYKQRPRLKPDRDYSARLPYFPDIEGREITEAVTTPRKKKRPWKISIDGARASGSHAFWIWHISGGGSGTLSADMSIATAGGELVLDGHDIDLDLGPAYLNGTEETFHRGRITGRLGFAPFVPRENKGLRMLAHVLMDARLQLDVDSLAFINLFTANLGDLVIDGSGQVEGRLHYEKGYVLPGTDLKIAARDLDVSVRKMEVGGYGTVELLATGEAATPLSLDIDYQDLAVTRDGDSEPFVVGDNLLLHLGGTNFILPDSGLDFDTLVNDEAYRERRKNANVRLSIESATMTNLAVLNEYLLPNNPLQITGGSANLNADVNVLQEDMDGSVTLRSQDLALEFEQQQFGGNLAADMVISGGVLRDMQFDISGSRVELNEVSVIGEEDSFSGEGWAARIDLDEARTVVDQPPQLDARARLQISDSRPVVALFNNQGDPPRFLSKLLVLKDISGTAEVAIANGVMRIPSAHMISDRAEVGAKGIFAKDDKHGVVYARYERLDALLKFSGGDRNLDILRVREKYDDYRLAPAAGD